MRGRKLLGIKAGITICGERKQLDLKDKTRMFCASTAEAHTQKEGFGKNEGGHHK